MLETIRESRSLKAPLPPRAEKWKESLKENSLTTKYFGDQDPSDEEGLEYAKAYHQMQLKALVTKNKLAQQTLEKSGDTRPTDSPNSDDSNHTFICNMSAAQEPLYGDPGEEDFWKE